MALLRRAVLRWKYSVSGDQKGVDPWSVPLNEYDIKVAETVVVAGGRLNNSSVSEDGKFPIIISPESPVAISIIRSIHLQMGHGGREQVLS